MEQKEIYIETERIIIRNFKQKDAEGLLEYLSNPRVNCFAGDRLCSAQFENLGELVKIPIFGG